MELVLYYIKESANLIVSFLVAIIILALWCYLIIKNFRQDSRWKVIFYGLFFRIKDIDLLRITCVIVRTFLVIYTAIIYSNNIYINLSMIIICAVLYIILMMKRFIYEVLCAIIQLITIYFIYILNNYMIEMQYSRDIYIVGIALKSFVIIFAMYFFFKNISDIVEKRNNLNLKKSGKVIEKA